VLLPHFDLQEQPFDTAPDPRYLFAGKTHREALSSLLHEIEAGLDFVALIAKPGMGKTTLLFEILRRMDGKAKTIFLFQTIHTPTDLVRALLFEFGASDLTRNVFELQAQLKDILVAHCAAGKRVIVFIDDAQNLSEPGLEAVRMLSRFETTRHKLIQIVLSGRPHLAEKLAWPEMLQLRRRTSILCHLKPLSPIETTDYIHHRLRIAGRDPANPLFTRSALASIARWSDGIPRSINDICFHALSLGCPTQHKTIDSDVIEGVVSNLALESRDEPTGAAPRVVWESGYAVSLEPSAGVPASKVRVLLSLRVGAFDSRRF
jgi:general secretion pathway protein A